jgi:methyl-accepting chemotaxis protein
VTQQATAQQGRSYHLLGTLATSHGDLQSLLGIKDIDELEKRIKGLEAGQKEIQELFAADTTAFAGIKPKYDALRTVEQAVIDDILRGNNAVAQEKFFGSVAQQYDNVLAELHQTRQAMEAATADELARHNAQAKKNLLWQSGGLGLLMIGLLLFGWRLKTHIVTALTRISDTVAETSQQLSLSAQQFAHSSHSLAETASQEAASLEETSASLEEISSMTKRNAENAARGKSLGTEARGSASTGLDRLAQMNATLGAIKTAVVELEAAVREIQTSSQEVAKIIKTIDEIAFQTNLLALNAAVEAARAGEAGMGFAVVADEVRSLAQRSAQAARDTSEQIAAAVKRSELGGLASKKVAQSLGEVQTTAGGLEQVFNGIAKQVKELDEVMAQISSASQEQNQGIGEVNVAVGQMDKVTQSNAASAEENASAAEQLSSQAATLQQIVTQLQRVVTGKVTATPGTTEHSSPHSLAAPTGKPTSKPARRASLPPGTDEQQAAFPTSLTTSVAELPPARENLLIRP